MNHIITRPAARVWNLLRRPALWSMVYFVPAVVVVIGILLFRTEGLSPVSLATLLGLPIGFLMFFNPISLMLAAVFSLFVMVDALYLKVVVWSSFAVLVSYFVNRMPGDEPDVRNPIALPFFVLIGSIIPSFYNTVHLGQSIVALINPLSMTIMAVVVAKLARDESVFAKVVFIYLGAAVANGGYLIVESLETGRRAFGFTGIVYVDYVCIAILVTVILMLYFRSRLFLPLLLMILLFVIALVFTQTRNTIVSLAASLGFIFLYVYRNPSVFQIDRKKLFGTAIVLGVLFVLLVAFLLAVAPQAFERIMDLGSKQSLEVRNEGDFARNSWVTRLLIWHTSLNAFMQHPVIGIGAYAFPYDSRYYYTIPAALFKMFVQGLSPHETIVTLLTETGIVGFLGFLFFAGHLFAMGRKAFRKSVTNLQLHISFGLLVAQFYIFCSMLLTDAWLWGQCGMLWSIVIGLSLGNYRNVMRSRGDDVNR